MPPMQKSPSHICMGAFCRLRAEAVPARAAIREQRARQKVSRAPIDASAAVLYPFTPAYPQSSRMLKVVFRLHR